MHILTGDTYRVLTRFTWLPIRTSIMLEDLKYNSRNISQGKQGIHTYRKSVSSQKIQNIEKKEEEESCLFYFSYNKQRSILYVRLL